MEYLGIVLVLAAISFQGEALKCYQCNSNNSNNSVSAQCLEFESSSWTSLSKPCLSTESSCVSLVNVNGTTVRGCLDTVLKEHKLDKCEGANCLKCQGDNCNTDNVPENRPKCYQCDEETPNCKAKVVFLLSKPCLIYDKDQSCYTSVSKDGLKVKRGCTNDKDSVHQNKEYLTKVCKTSADGTGCNTINAVKSITCHKCTEKNEVCKWTMRNSILHQCKTNSLLETPSCYTFVNGTSISRGCLKDLDSGNPVLKACEDSNSKLCKTCAGENCNKDKTTSHECFKCESATCHDISKLTAAKCVKPEQYKEDAGCYTLQQSDKVLRGCSMDMTDSLKTKCDKYGGFCKKCDTDQCNKEKIVPNKEPVKQCYTCDSSKDGIKCVDSDLSVDATWWKGVLKTCSFINETTCVSLMNGGKTIRGCLSDVLENNGLKECKGENCISCTCSACNNVVVPENRPECHQCDSLKDPSCGNDITGVQPKSCLVYEKQPSCYTSVAKEGSQVRRGCTNDPDSVHQNTTFVSLECKESSCNGKVPVTCNVCTEGDELCQWSMKEKYPNLALCKDTTEFDEVCYSYTKGTKVARGCLADLSVSKANEVYDACKSDSKACKKCTGDRCNKEKLTAHECYVCDDLETCHDVSKLQTSKCVKEVQYKEDAGCFSLQQVNKTTRGCTMDMSKNIVDKCTNFGKYCSKCTSDKCNKDALKPNTGNGFKCNTCDSDKDGIECVQGDEKYLNSKSSGCEYIDEDSCISKVDGAKTIRGCASSLNLKGCTEPNCLKCKGKDCNKGLVPAKRPLCHHCDSDTNDECGKEIAENGAKPTVCLNFNFRELCYTSVSISSDQNLLNGAATSCVDHLTYLAS
ncbi:prestalk protein-like [Ctenocephalides felis]|uniref:prestalk protein-like n=1 Tax=Ctenocephalides felis TaxID=7515 RepID=UPI000E6E2C00|nr:prestalk protein-like [Ctenocephalides felis]